MEMFQPKIGEKRKEALAMPGAHMLLVEEYKVLCDVIEQNVHIHSDYVWIANNAQSTLAIRSFPTSVQTRQ
jgi:hypothetical protein